MVVFDEIGVMLHISAGQQYKTSYTVSFFILFKCVCDVDGGYGCIVYTTRAVPTATTSFRENVFVLSTSCVKLSLTRVYNARGSVFKRAAGVTRGRLRRTCTARGTSSYTHTVMGCETTRHRCAESSFQCRD
uniref:Uncharacterized protein n=1 Tax=Lygus hesperus TaxID=30085 RepID=A0A146M3Q0_LYGHE